MRPTLHTLAPPSVGLVVGGVLGGVLCAAVLAGCGAVPTATARAAATATATATRGGVEARRLTPAGRGSAGRAGSGDSSAAADSSTGRTSPRARASAGPAPGPAGPAGPALPALPALASPGHAVRPVALVLPSRPARPAAVAAVARRHPDTTVVLSGVVELDGAATSALGVGPSSFRWFTPGATLHSDPLWQAVQHGQVAVSYALAAQRHLHLGQRITLGTRSVRVGAEADFGLSQAAVVVDRTLASRLGAHAEELLVGRVDPATLAAGLRPLLGAAAVVDLVPAPAPPAATSSPAASSRRPTTWHQLYLDAAATCPGLSWTVLAAIGQVESGDGSNDGPSSAGALGPMQFMPATWREYGYSPFGGTVNVFDPVDAVYSAARMLCSDGATAGPRGLSGAVFAYNHAGWYVREVIALAGAYRARYG